MEPAGQHTTLRKLSLLFILLFSLLFAAKPGNATHGQGADLTYTCLGNGDYELRVSFYRDCAGISAPSTIDVDASSDNCNEDLTVTLDRVPGTGNDVTPICDSEVTECNGGSHPGVEEYVYKGTVTLPQKCSDWNFDFSVCCRNRAITTIDDPNNEELHLNAELDNKNFPCNSSPSFSNPPVPYICVGETYCFNHGAQDPDGDSLSYSLVTPSSSANGDSVDYKNGYSSDQPLKSNPGVNIDPVTGDICMTPTQQEVTVMQVQVKEWRNGQVIGTINRDIQVQVVSCNNRLPYLSGIEGDGSYQEEVCAGEQVQFKVPSFDKDSSQDVDMSWNNGIAGASFTIDTGQRPTGYFDWTPGPGHIGNGPHCFTVTVEDDNCPLNGSQTYSFCFTVTGIDSLSLSSKPANCGASNGAASVDRVHGGSGPFSYDWTPAKGGNNSADYNGIPADTYTVEVTDANGCKATDSIAVDPGSMPGKLQMTKTQPSCEGGQDGTASVKVNGGKGPYRYTWSNGDTTATADSLSAGTYYVDVITDEGCHSSDTISIQDPKGVDLSLDSLSDPLCHGDSNAYASVSAQGGQKPYSYEWSTTPVKTGDQVNDLYAGTFTVSVTDDEGCSDSKQLTVQDPPALSTSMSVQDPSCHAGTDGQAKVSVSGGHSPYQYDWIGQASGQASLKNIGTGQYVVEVTDANGCTIRDTADLDAPAPLSVQLRKKTEPVCHGDEGGSLTVSAGGGTAPYKYHWQGIPQSGSNISGLNAGTYVLEVEDANGCVLKDSFDIQQPAPLQVQIDKSFDVSCYGGSDGAATASASGGTGPYSFSWDVDSAQTGKSAFGLSAGTHSVTVTDANGCEANANFTIDEPAPLDVQVQPVSDTICPDDSITLTANASGGNGQYIYVWGQGLGTGATHKVAPDQTTDYTVIAYDTAGCSSNGDTVHIEVRELEQRALEVEGNGPICEGEMAEVRAIYKDEGTQVDYLWDQNIGAGKGPHHVLPNDTSTYTVTVSDQCQNAIEDSVTVAVHPEPPVKAVVPDAEGCGEVGVVCKNDTPRSANTELQWYLSTGDTLDELQPEVTFKNSGKHSAKLMLTSEHGCRNTDKENFSVDVHPVPSAEFEMNPSDGEISIMDPEVKFHYNDPYAVQWNFAFGDGDSSTSRDPSHVYERVGTYPVTLFAKTIHGCKAEKVKEIKVKERFSYYVPNAFSPDGDGVNDRFDGRGEGYTKRYMKIFDRWGELIFESHDRSLEWDGTVNGRKVKPDVYVYKIRVKDYKGDWHTKKGHVTVVR
jgi:gliding motility-associated-like protein